MGQQQLLLIVLGVIVVGVAVFIGIHLFKSNAIEQKRDLLINEGITVANNAREYFHKPRILGGGSLSFNGWEIPNKMITSGNGSYAAQIFEDQVEIIGTGNELISGDVPIEVKFIVSSIGIETEIIN